jgi:hypothetical protein
VPRPRHTPAEYLPPDPTAYSRPLSAENDFTRLHRRAIRSPFPLACPVSPFANWKQPAARQGRSEGGEDGDTDWEFGRDEGRRSRR